MPMNDCLFCKIVNREIKSEILFENEYALIFKDSNPQAPVHLLAIPKKHISSILEISSITDRESHELLIAIANIAKDLELDRAGFRVVTNMGTAAGQSVNHLHFHILGKRNFNWPPG